METVLVVAVVGLALAVAAQSWTAARTNAALCEQIREFSRQNVSWAKGEQDRLAVEVELDRINLARERANPPTQRGLYDVAEATNRPVPYQTGYDIETPTLDSPVRD